VTARARLSTEFGPALGVAPADFNGDGRIDIYVANHGQPNQLSINQRNGTFKNTALLAGARAGRRRRGEVEHGVEWSITCVLVCQMEHRSQPSTTARRSLTC